MRRGRPDHGRHDRRGAGRRSRPADPRSISTRWPSATSATQGATPSFLGYKGTYPAIDLRVDRRRDRPRHPVGQRGCSRRATCSRSTSGPSGRGSTATPRSPCSWADRRRRRRPRSWSKVTEDALDAAIDAIRVRRAALRHRRRHRARRGGRRVLGVVREYGGHGIGRSMHEEPFIQNLGSPGRGPELRPGLVIAVEPMLILGSEENRVLADGWTVVTADGSLAAHFEHTIAVTEDGHEVLTAPRMSSDG